MPDDIHSHNSAWCVGIRMFHERLECPHGLVFLVLCVNVIVDWVKKWSSTIMLNVNPPSYSYNPFQPILFLG